MRTKRDPGRGVRRLPVRAGRPNAFGVQWSEMIFDPAFGKMRRKVRSQFFPTAELRERRFHELCRDKRQGSLRTISRDEIEQWTAFKQSIGATPWSEVVAGWQAYRLDKGLSNTAKTVAEWFGECLERAKELLGAGKISPDNFRQKKHKWGLFAAVLGDRKLATIRSGDVEDWLRGFNFGSMVTRDSHLKHVSVAFNAAVKQRLLTHNPCEEIAKLEVKSDHARHTPIEGVAALFHTAQTNDRFKPMLGRLALEFFAGVRYSSALRLTREDVNQKDRGIRHPASSIKTRRRQYVEGYPEVLWAWLKVAPESGWHMSLRHYVTLKCELFDVAKVPHPRNTARHTFCTYHVAAGKDASRTAFLLCHVNAQKLWDTYKGNATTKDGLRFLALTPTQVAKVAARWVKTGAGESQIHTEARQGGGMDFPRRTKGQTIAHDSVPVGAQVAPHRFSGELKAEGKLRDGEPERNHGFQAALE